MDNNYIDVEIDFNKYGFKISNKGIAIKEAFNNLPDGYIVNTNSIKFFLNGIKRFARVEIIKLEENNVFIA